MAPETHSFGVEPLTCHAWNGDKSQIAVSHNNHEVKIYSRSAQGKWVEKSVLKEHAQRVTGIDWAANSNRIVTCGADRNAYVWTLQSNGTWTPTLVILRINRAATCVKWSPQENKFAVGSGSRNICVCYFDKENDFFVSKQIKKPIKSTVTSVDWHPDNILLACGSSDFRTRVFSGYVKDVDEKPEATSWGKKMTFGNLMAEFSNGGGGWVHSVSFSADGEYLAWVGHDSSVSVVDAANGQCMATVKTKYLPYTTCVWISRNSLMVAGHDCCPMLYQYDGSGNMKFVAKMENNKKSTGSKFSAMQHFKSLSSKATTSDENTTALDTVHQNTITQISILRGDKGNCSKFTTSGTDGQLVIWDTQDLESAMGGLRLN